MSDLQLNELADDFKLRGYYFPLDVLGSSEIGRYLKELRSFEERSAGMKLGNKGQLNYPHAICSFANEIVRNERILDAVEAIIGPDILLWGSTFFFKEPRTEDFVSWHQDMRYWGLKDPDALVSAWLALVTVNRENGCMRFVPGSHISDLVNHMDTYDDSNILTRGQEAEVDIKESDVVYVELEPGQISLHHGYLLHSSMPNNSDARRLGYTMNYIAPHNRQEVATSDFAMLLRGEDRYGYFQMIPEPNQDLSPESLEWHARILNAQNEAMYEGAPVAAT